MGLSEIGRFGESHVVDFDHLIVNLGVVFDKVAEDVAWLDVIVFVDPHSLQWQPWPSCRMLRPDDPASPL